MTALLLQLGLSALISLAVIVYLRRMLQRVLERLCANLREDQGLGAQYWTRMLDVMMLIAPILLVILFAKDTGTAAELLRSTLLLSLMGQFISLSIVGYQINAYAQREQAAHQENLARMAYSEAHGHPEKGVV